jgi:tRNA (uracil-5-)-methyltransferase
VATARQIEVALMPLSRVNPAQYEQLLSQKVASTSSLLRPFAAPAPQVFPSQPGGYRLRAEFRIWHEGDDLNYVMFRPQDPKTPVAIHNFSIADKQIQQLMPVLREKLISEGALRRKLFQVEFLVTLAGDALVSLIYHRKLEQAWESAATTLAQELNISIVGRSRKQKLVIGRDYVEEVLSINGKEYNYRQYEQAFTQPNGKLNICMIEWACDRARVLAGDLLELYCGNGNFTLPLSRQFDQVIATELSKASIRAARENLRQNRIDNIQMIRLSAEEVTQAMTGVREFRRLAELPMPLDQYDLRTIFVDPPRAGLDEHTVQMATTFESIIYVSCNPQTLAKNLQTLSKTHRIEHFALFDQFPYTDHMECGVFLRRSPQ